jgi:hypothetical protein
MREKPNELETPAAMAEYLRTMGSETGDQIAAELEAQQAAIALAYGLLWLCPDDRKTVNGERIYQARQTLRAMLDSKARILGLKAAQDLTPLPAKMN